MSWADDRVPASLARLDVVHKTKRFRLNALLSEFFDLLRVRLIDWMNDVRVRVVLAACPHADERADVAERF